MEVNIGENRKQQNRRKTKKTKIDTLYIDYYYIHITTSPAHPLLLRLLRTLKSALSLFDTSDFFDEPRISLLLFFRFLNSLF